MLIEIDQVAVLRADWIGVLQGNREAARRIARQVDGLDIYMHSLNMPPGDWMLVNLRDLEAANILFGAKLQADPRALEP